MIKEAAGVDAANLWICKPSAGTYFIHYVTIGNSAFSVNKRLVDHDPGVDPGEACPNRLEPLAFKVWDPFFRCFQQGKSHAHAELRPCQHNPEVVVIFARASQVFEDCLRLQYELFMYKQPNGVTPVFVWSECDLAWEGYNESPFS